MPRQPDSLAEEKLGAPADGVIDSLVAGQQRALQSMESAGAAMLDGLTCLGREMTAFVSERMRHDIEAQQALMRCRNAEELRAVQARFLRVAADQYGAETTRLVKLGGEVMARSLERAAR